MEIIGYGLIIIGAVIGLICGIQLLVLAFRTSILWGLGCLFVPFVALIFVVVHWDEAKTPFLRGLLAIPFYIVGIILLPHTTG